MIMSTLILLKKEILHAKFSENKNTRFMFNNFVPKSRTVNEGMWKNVLEPDRPLTKIWRMCTACWIRKVTKTSPDYVILVYFTQHCFSIGVSGLR
jgi:hypothetical protein